MKTQLGCKLAFATCLTLVLGCASKPQPEQTSPQTAGVSAPAPSEKVDAAAATSTKRTRKDPPPKPDISCVRADETRALAIEEVHNGCWLFYVNRGIKKRIAWSKNGNAHCEKVRDQIRVSLEKGNFKCKWD